VLKTRPSRGFSMVELMIGIVIMAVLMVLGFPAYTTYLANAKLRTSAESLMTGMQLARSEAVRRNTTVEFLLTTDEARALNLETTNLSPTSLSWMVRVPLANGLHEYVDGKSWFQDSGQKSTDTPAVTIDGGAISSILFNGLGATNLAAQATFDFKNPNGGACAVDGGPMRCLRLVVAVGGQARMCDPAAPTKDTRTC
jgi:type IV fimbrial biogenesis protein FimT